MLCNCSTRPNSHTVTEMMAHLFDIAAMTTADGRLWVEDTGGTLWTLSYDDTIAIDAPGVVHLTIYEDPVYDTAYQHFIVFHWSHDKRRYQAIICFNCHDQTMTPAEPPTDSAVIMWPAKWLCRRLVAT